jgi:hypothetical protein
MQLDAEDEGIPFFKPVGISAVPPAATSAQQSESGASGAEAAATATTELGD